MLLVGCGQETEQTGTMPENVEEESDIVEVEIENLDEIEQIQSQPSQPVQKSKKRIIVAVIGAPATEILESAAISMQYSDYEIEAVICDDYNKPNDMVLSGDADACLYENRLYLESYNKRNTTDLTIVERSYYEPLAVFAGTVKDLNDIPSGVKVAVQNGDVNRARALYLMKQKGLLDIKEGSYYQASMEDVIDNPYDISLEEVDIAGGWPDASAYGLIICDKDRAMLAGIDPDTSLGEENRNSELLDMFSICLVTAKGKENGDKIKELSKALNSDLVEEFITEKYHGAVVDYR